MEVKEEKFSKADCWIFLSVPQNKTGGDLEKVIEVADAINNRIPERREIIVAMNKGLRAKIIIREGEKFVLTHEFQSFMDRVFKQNGAPHSIIDALYSRMKDWPDEVAPAGNFELSEEEYRKARYAFKKNFSNAYKNI